ncbi:MAG: hypothetical protein K9G76_09510 [Bacteroidales bacterium]|nr:hypothetical protein [Bacteroidales bacterium]MCF8403935.1 hypothetical protein [Bacteroidales bacterium]
MHKIICDNNVWFGIASGEIPRDKIWKLNLIGTSTNIFELAANPLMRDKPNKLKGAIRHFKNYNKEIILENPMDFLLNSYVPPFDIDNSLSKSLYYSLFDYLNFDYKIPFDQYKGAMELVDHYIKKKKELANYFNSVLSESRKIMKQNGGKRNYKFEGHTESWKKYIILVFDDYNKKIYNSQVSLDIEKVNWEKFELFINVWSKYFYLLETDPLRKFDFNDIHDLLNMIYVKPGQKYWTLEKKWIRIIKDLECYSEYIFELN